MKKWFNSVRDFVTKLSTKPHYESYTWGTHSSMFARCFYHVVYVLRFLSPLQWYKTIWREKNKNKSARDGKERKDFHALHSEYYLLAVLVLALADYFFYPTVGQLIPNHLEQVTATLNTVRLVVLIWLAIESILWILYYMLLRILIEKRLSIFNEAEYFIVLPIVLLTQIVLFACIFNAQLAEVLSTLFNLPFANQHLSSTTKLGIGMIGYVYTVLIIANIINLIPALPVRRRPNITIIGAGDVVEKRILPALMERNFYRTGQLSIASDKIGKEFKQYLRNHNINYFEALKDSDSSPLSFARLNNIRQDIVNYTAKRSSYAIIATPTDEHFPYMTALAKKGIVFATEKPLVGNRAELNAMKNYGENIMAGGFLLSYYWLEKALPFNYFLSLNANYRDFLDVISLQDTAKPVSPNTLAYIQQRLGKPTGISIEFYEQEETREWALLKETGGFYFEAFIHPVTLLMNTLGEEFDADNLTIDWYNSEQAQQYYAAQKDELGANFIHLRSSNGNCKVDIKAGKFTGQKKRYMNVKYARGDIQVDLDEMYCTINWPQGGHNAQTRIAIKAEFKSPYATQMRLYDLFVNESGNWVGQRFDDYPNQSKVLAQMIELLETKATNHSFYHPKCLTIDAMDKLIGESTRL